MIRHIKLLRNIGTFNSDNSIESIDLRRLVLIYAENGRGKSTLADILRSLARNDIAPILGRRRLGSKYPPHIVLDVDTNPPNVMFQYDTWTRTLPEIKIFDEVFVDENVYSGLEVDPQHRQNLHELVLGDQGVALSRNLQELISRRKQHNKALSEKGMAIPDQVRNGLDVDEFCALQPMPNVEDEIKNTERALEASRNQHTVQKSPPFDMITLPALDSEAIGQLLSTDLPSLSEDAESQVRTHVASLGEGGEQWVAEGMKRSLQGTEENCPFCGQNVAGLALLAHFRAYFNEGYAQLKQAVAEMLDTFQADHTGDAQVEFERAIKETGERRQFWARFCDLPDIDIDTATIVNDWNYAKEDVVRCLKAKQSAPLEQRSLSRATLDSIGVYDAHVQEIRSINKTLASLNSTIQDVKDKVATTDDVQINDRLSHLRAIKARYSTEISTLCTDYLKEKERKETTEACLRKARKALGDFRSDVFPALQNGVNEYLSRFNAGFRLANFSPVNIGGGSTCSYNVVINKESIKVAGGTVSPSEPSFRNTLSAGDRNTLTLALFLSSLDKNPNLENTIVVIDDPISSLDDHRSMTTIQAVRNLGFQAQQVIVMSHNKSFLCDIWNGIERLNAFH